MVSPVSTSCMLGLPNMPSMCNLLIWLSVFFKTEYHYLALAAQEFTPDPPAFAFRVPGLKVIDTCHQLSVSFNLVI